MERTERSIGDYDTLFEPIRAVRHKKNGRQLGNPAKLAAAVLEPIASDTPPPQLLLGSDALQRVRDRLSRLEKGIADWEELTLSTDG